MRASMFYALTFLVSGCAGAQKEPPVIASTKSSIELRSMQSRLFETTDRSKTIRTVISTFQDMGYNIDKVDAGSGTVSATKLAQLKMSASVTPHGSRMAVRANAQVKLGMRSNQVDAPEFYQTLFFAPLSRSMFLESFVDNDPVAPSAPASAITRTLTGSPES